MQRPVCLLAASAGSLPVFKSVAPPILAPRFPPAKFSQSDKHLKGSSSIIKAQWIYNRRQRSSHLRPPGRSETRQTEDWNDRELVGIEPCSWVTLSTVCREIGEAANTRRCTGIPLHKGRKVKAVLGWNYICAGMIWYCVCTCELLPVSEFTASILLRIMQIRTKGSVWTSALFWGQHKKKSSLFCKYSKAHK